MSLDEFARRVGLGLKNPSLLLRALTHRSYINEHPEAIEERIVVSDIGEQWSPNTPPPSTAATTSGAETGSPRVAKSATSGIASGIMMAKVPQLVPVENAISPDTKNTSGAIHCGVSSGATCSATKRERRTTRTTE